MTNITLQQKSPSLKRNNRASVPIHIQVSVSDLFIPRIGPHIFCIRIGRPMVWIHKFLTNTWMWKSGLRPRNYFSGNICFELSLLCLCSVVDTKRINNFLCQVNGSPQKKRLNYKSLGLHVLTSAYQKHIIVHNYYFLYRTSSLLKTNESLFLSIRQISN